MPPLDIDLANIPSPELDQEIEIKKEIEKILEIKPEPVKTVDIDSLKEEMKSEEIKLEEIIVSIPLPIERKRKRPTVIGKEEEVKKIDFKNREMKNFQVLEQVGEGTYGKVYKAIDAGDKKMVAMKMIRMENEHQGFPITCLREIKNLQQLDHPNIIKLHDVTFDARHRTYLVFEFMNHDLLGLMSNGEMQFSEKNIFHIIQQVLQGLKFCHERSIIHRDLKSSNILLHNDGSVKLAGN
jgi:serine/threonine protein kinase